MSATAVSQPVGIAPLLRRCRQRAQLQSVIRGMADTILTLAVCILVGCLIDYLVPLPGLFRSVLLLLLIGATAVVFWRKLAGPLLRPFGNDELSAAVDLSCPDLHEGLASLVAFQKPGVSDAEAGSALMRRRLQRQVEAALQNVDEARIVDPRIMIRRCGIALLPILIMLAPALLWPSGSKLLLQRLLLPLANLSTVSNLYFEVPDGNRWVVLDSDVTFTAIPHWRTTAAGPIPDSVRVELRTTDGRVDQLPMAFNEVESHFIAKLPGVRQSLKYRIVGGGTESEWFEIQVADPPRITAALLTETPSAYTGRPIEVFDGAVGNIPVFERSELVLVIQFSKPVATATLQWDGYQPIRSEIAVDELADESVPPELRNPMQGLAEAKSDSEPPTIVPQLSADKRSATFQWSALGSGRFRVQATDELKLANPAEPERRLEVSEDKPPVLAVSGVTDQLELRPDDVLPLNCKVSDDVGVGSLEVRYKKNEDAERIEPAADFQRGSRSLEHPFRISLASLNLKTGDRLSVRIRTADERPIPEPNVVFSELWSIRINDKAEAVGTTALREEDQKLVDALKAIEQELVNDEQRAKELKDQLWKTWDDATQNSVRELSEKEQLQGRQLQELAGQVATHPLMQPQAEQLKNIAESVRDDIPRPLNEAVQSERNDAANKVQEAISELQRTREQLHQSIEQIEKLAQLEADLAQLNRLALEADRLAQQAKQLEHDQAANTPEEGQTPEEHQQELQDRSRQLSADRQRLTTDLERLLQERKELLESARQAQSEKLDQLSRQMQQLAAQQQQLADSVQEESREAARDAQAVAEQLQSLLNEANQLSQQQTKELPDVPRPDLSSLEEAIRDSHQGNLAQALQHATSAAEELRKSSEQLQQEPSGQPIAQQTSQLADRLDELNQQISKLAQKRGANESMTAPPTAPDADSATSSDPKAGDPKAGDPVVGMNDPQQQQQQQEAAAELLARLQKLVEASTAISESLRSDPKANSPAAPGAERAAKQGSEALDEAMAGQFAKAAGKMEQSANESQQAAQQLTEQEQQDRRNQLQSLADEMKQLADTVRQLEQSDAAQAAVRQSTQQDIADQSSQLPETLNELSERLSLPALGMQQQWRHASESQQSADKAAKAGQQASNELKDADLQDAAESGRETAGHLNRAAQQAGRAAEGRQQEPGPIPSEVGDSVAEALHNLERARRAARDAESSRRDAQAAKDAQAAQEQQAQGSPSEQSQSGQNGMPGDGNSPPGSDTAADANSDNPQTEGVTKGDSQDGQPGKGQPGSGKPAGSEGQPGNQPAEGQPGSESASSAQGEGQSQGQGKGKGESSGSQQLSDAAKALADAAKGSLPQEFTPGQVAGANGSNEGKGGQAAGNGQGWDGLLPGAMRSLAGPARRWGQVNDELDGEMRDASKDVVDTEYADLIRRYRRELARAAAGESAPKAPPSGGKASP